MFGVVKGGGEHPTMGAKQSHTHTQISHPQQQQKEDQEQGEETINVDLNTWQQQQPKIPTVTTTQSFSQCHGMDAAIFGPCGDSPCSRRKKPCGHLSFQRVS